MLTMSFERQKVIFTIDSLRKLERENVARLRSNSTKIPISNVIGLRHGLNTNYIPRSDACVSVYINTEADIEKLSNTHGATGTTMRIGKEYFIFIEKYGDSEIHQAIEKLNHCFLVLHEYAHIIHRDVFEDKEESEQKKLVDIMNRPLCQRVKGLKEYYEIPENYANGYATDRVNSLLGRKPCDKNKQMSSNLLEVKANNDWISPSVPQYLAKFPHLENEPEAWIHDK